MKPIKVRLEGGALVLNTKGRWDVEGKPPAEAVEKAQMISLEYRYSPADGYPGCYLATLVAEAVGGTAELPDVPPNPEGTVC